MNTRPSVIPAELALRLLRRGALYWLLVRLMILAVSRGKVGIATPTLPGMIFAAAIAGILAYTELSFFREKTLAANLGIWHGWYAVLPAAASVLVDALLWTMLPALRTTLEVIL